MKEIVLATFNARYTHASLALRYLYANLKEFKQNAIIEEFVINEDPQKVAEDILYHSPKVVAISVYIWNAVDCRNLIEIIKKISPKTLIIVGGPEVSHLPHRVDFSLADFVIIGEGEMTFYDLVSGYLSKNCLPKERLIRGSILSFDQVELPYSYYTDSDIAHRYIYVEASRGCPFECEFCLSSIDERVRYFDADQVLAELEKLIARGAKRFKFVDRTFNINLPLANRLIDFFLSQKPITKAHFEVIPEAFPASLKSRLKEFGEGDLQLEIGIQTLNKDIAKNISRTMNYEKIRENIIFLENETKAHLHIDLIVGLPGESLKSFGEGLNDLLSFTRSEIQIGILKKLSGTLINRHDEMHGMIYSDQPPYDVLQTADVSFVEIQQMKRFARFWDIVYNSFRFKQTVEYIFGDDPFNGFMNFSNFVYKTTHSTYQISFIRVCELIFDYLVDQGFEREKIAQTMAEDTGSFKGNNLPKKIADLVK